MRRLLIPALGLMLAACVTIHPGGLNGVRAASGGDGPTAATASGPVRGIEAKGGRAFLGLPYAAPPTGELRWRAPRPAPAWAETRDASRIGPDCTQAIGRKAVLGGGGGVVMGSEDCLYLNVYAPAGEAPSARPVMVYLHGGAFTIGSGANYDPSRLAMTQGRVVVMVNYRLGALGWLAHPGFAADGEGVGGNWGLMDQQAALRWVHANIAAFGGDPADVTLFAESSGAWSACHLMASPGSEGLYQRIILQSGPCLEPSSLVDAQTAASAGPDFAASVGCEGPDAAACLRRTPAARIARAASTRAGLNGPGSWGPVYGDAVVPLSPAEAFATGRFVRTPVILGTNLDEGRLFAVEVRSQDRYDRETGWMYGDHGQAVLDRYPVGPDRPGLTIARSFTDQKFACPSNAMRRVLARWVPVHGYEFADRDAPFLIPAWIAGYDMGAWHASELAYVFGTSWLLEDAGRFTPAQRALSDRMMGLWAGFGHDPDFEAAWPRVSDGGEPVRVFAPEGDWMDATFFDRHQCAFWDGSEFGAILP